jgi:UTP--glucose-1-phosphate uridylyltransferase
MSDGLQASIEKMEREGVPGPAIATFGHYYEQLAAGESGMIPEDEIEPVTEVPASEELPPGDPPLDQAVVIKLNGGLGTSMGMDRAKSLLPVKEGLAFLDVIARQVMALREASGARLPLVLMNSFYTRDDSLALLERYPDLAADVPFDFVQHKEPKLLVDGLTPVEWPPNPAIEWCPPGHGDIYPALLTSGSCWTAATATRSCRTPTTSAPCWSRASWPGSPPRGCRTSRRSRRARRPTARAATSRTARRTGA